MFVTAVAIPAHAMTRQYWVCSTVTGVACALLFIGGGIATMLASGYPFQIWHYPLRFFVLAVPATAMAMLVGAPFALWRRWKRKPTPVRHFVD